MADIRGLADAYHIEPVAFFQTDNWLMVTDEEHQRVVIDANVFVSLSCDERDRLLSRLRQCTEALITVPEEFADQWIAGLKAYASIVAHEMKHRLAERTRVQSLTPIERPIPGASEGNLPKARRRSKPRKSIVTAGRKP